MITRLLLYVSISAMIVGCSPTPGHKLSTYTVQVMDDSSCMEEIPQHTVRIWVVRNHQIKELVLVDSLRLTADNEREISFLSLDEAYLQLVGVDACRSTWKPIQVGRKVTQQLSYSSGISYLSVDNVSVNADERDTLRIHITRVDGDANHFKLPGDESNIVSNRISYADLPIDSLALTTGGFYEVEIFNVSNRQSTLQSFHYIIADEPTIHIDF